MNIIDYYLYWWIYSSIEAVLITKRDELIGKKKFASIALDQENDVFVVHLAFIRQYSDTYPYQSAQIAFLETDKGFTSVLSKYVDFTDIFFKDLAIDLPEHIGIINYAINLIERHLLFYGLIYSLGPVELETLKINIETN